jgi:multiple antibiotic resistance protein
MLRIHQILHDTGRRLCLRSHPRFVAAYATVVGCLVHADIASAAEAAAGEGPVKQFAVAKIFTFLFLMLGPFKIIGPFLKIAKGADAAFARQLAFRSTLFASLALLLAAVIGEKSLGSYGIPVPVLALSAGIILFLVALLHIIKEFDLETSHGESTSGTAPTPTLAMALSPLAFPTIVTPYGIAALVVFLAVSPDLHTQLMVGAIVLAIMLLNLIVMLLARHIRPVMGVALQILGAVLGIVQVALGLQIMYSSVKALGLL